MTAGHRVLVVDDESTMVRALTRMLEATGYDVAVAHSGAAAEFALRGSRFDCLVLDYRIPDVRGDAIYAYAMATQPHLAGKALFVTGDVSERTHDAIASTGCPVLVKPFDANVLVGAVQRLCDQ
jgi:DNA-binding response OmpR family regulator